MGALFPDLVHEGRAACHAGVQLVAQTEQRGGVETSPHLAGVFELSPIVVTDEERPKAHPASAGVGEAADHKLLFVDAFELQPVGGSSMDVFAVPALRDQPLEALLTRLPIELFSFRVPVSHESHWCLKIERLSKQLLPVLESDLGHVEAVDIHEVEQVVEDRDPAPAGFLRVLDSDPPLKLGEAGAITVEGNNLTVDHTVMVGPPLESLGDLRVRVVQSQLVPGEEANGPAFLKREASLAVQFVLKDPVGVREPPVGEGGKHGLDPRWLPRRTRALLLSWRQEGEDTGHAPLHSRRRAGRRAILATSSSVRPVRTDRGCVFVRSRPGAASASCIFTRSQVSCLPRRKRVRANPPFSFFSLSQTAMWPSRNPCSSGTGRPLCW